MVKGLRIDCTREDWQLVLVCSKIRPKFICFVEVLDKVSSEGGLARTDFSLDHGQIGPVLLVFLRVILCYVGRQALPHLLKAKCLYLLVRLRVALQIQGVHVDGEELVRRDHFITSLFESQSRIQGLVKRDADGLSFELEVLCVDEIEVVSCEHARVQVAPNFILHLCAFDCAHNPCCQVSDVAEYRKLLARARSAHHTGEALP